jgi:hypothetical protein
MSKLENDLRASLQSLDLPDAPPRLEASLEAVVASPRPARRQPLTAVGLVAAVAVLLTALVLARPITDTNVAAPTMPGLAGSMAPTASAAAASPAATVYAFPGEVNGLHVYRVSELLAGRAAGTLPKGSVPLQGYWSGYGWAHSCPAPMGNPGVLEIYCHDGEFGITEFAEPVLVRHSVGNMTYTEAGTKGPKLTPYVPEAIYPQLQLPEDVNGQPYPPVPIVVVGHFDDPGAADCRSEARQICKDRFVIDRLVTLAIDAVPSPGVTPVPTPYQPGPSETPPFEASSCTASQTGAAHPMSFVGWTDGARLQLTSGLDLSGVTVYAAITRDAVPLGEWFKLPGDTRESLPMGRLVCYAFGGGPNGGGVAFDSLAGTYYRLYRDGSTARPSGAP